jgi:hypothetical protein
MLAEGKARVSGTFCSGVRLVRALLRVVACKNVSENTFLAEIY